MKRAKTYGLLLCSLMIMLLAACSGNSQQGGGNDSQTGQNHEQNAENSDTKTEIVELTFMTLGSNGYEKLVEEWNAAHPEIQVSIQNTGDQTAHHNNLLTALSANSGAPDLFQMEIAFIDQFLKHEDKFYNLNELGAEELKGQYLDWKWQQASSEDGSFQLGLPTDIGPTAVFYRKDLIEAAGLPSDPDAFSAEIDTWEKFAQTAKAYTDSTGKPFTDITDLVFNALRDQSDGEIYYSRDGELIIEENPQIKKAYDFTVKGINEGWISKSPLWSAEWYKGMDEGEFAVTLSPAWMMSVVKGNAPNTEGHWMIAQMPEGAGNWGGSFITLPKEGKHPEEAFAFAKWLTGKEKQLQSFQEDGLFPSIPALYEEPEFIDYTDAFFGNQQTGVALGKAAQTVTPVYYGPLHDTTDSYVKNALRNVMESGADPEEEWASVVDQAKKLAARQ